MTWNIIQILVNFLQSFVMYKTLDLYYERRIEYKYSVELVIAVNTALLSIINFNYSVGTKPYLYIAYYFLLIIMCIIIFKGNPVSKIVTVFLVIAFVGVSELIAASLIWLITDIDIKSLNEEGFGRLLAVIISQAIIIFSYNMVKKRINKEKMNLRNNIYYFLVGSIMFLTVVIIITVIWMYGNISENPTNLHLVILTLCVSILTFLSISLTAKIIKDMEDKHNLDLELQHMKMEQKYFSDVNSALEEIRILRHDMRGELAIIHGYNELNQKEKIRNLIEKKLTEMDVQLIPKMDNDNVIASFLNFKVKEALLNNIKIEIQSNLSEGKIINVDMEDICRILNNILNNAIEACKKCDGKYIKLQINNVNNYIVIKCENPFSGELISEGGIIQTLKKYKTQHGYGLKSINTIANKYNGILDIHYNDNVLYVEIQMVNKNYNYA